ncbi:MAG: YbhB/YbcL family Raf kinase inhibitor-like protein [Bauldia sp.]
MATRRVRQAHLAIGAVFASVVASTAGSADGGFRADGQIPLGAVAGRIDHLAIDLVDGLLFVAELSNGSVSAINLATRTVVARASGLAEPQGIAYLDATHTLYVATGGDGMLRTFSVPELTPGPTIAIGSDADNIHANPQGTLIAVGFANGLALVDPATFTLTASIALDGHAEGFAFDAAGNSVFINIPGADQIAVVDVPSASVVARWSTGAPGFNFPLVIDADRVLVGLRSPAGLGVYDAMSGALTAALPLCGDSDDLLTDPRRGVVYAVCGEGLVQIFRREGEAYVAAGETSTGAGARTGLFVPELDRIFVAVPARGADEARILVLVPGAAPQRTPAAVPAAAQLAPPFAIQTLGASALLVVRSDDLLDNEPIPDEYAARNGNRSPPLRWEGAPLGARSFVVLLENSEAETAAAVSFWAVYNIPGDVTAIPAGIGRPTPAIAAPAGAMQARNSFGSPGYQGPDPAPGTVSTFHFEVFALDVLLNLPAEADAQAVIAAMAGHVLAAGELVAEYGGE